MESKSPDQLNMTLPPYSVLPKVTSTGKKWIVGISLVILLALIIVAGSLVGVYMTQKHTEQMMTVAFENTEGEKILQTVSINERDEAAAIYVHSDNYPGTFLFDYKKKLIAIRKPNNTKCYVLRMDETKTPTLSTLMKGLEYFHAHDATAHDKISYNLKEVEEANLSDVGFNIYLMCSDANIYWAKDVNAGQRGFGIGAEGHIEIFGVHLGGGFHIGIHK